MLERASAIHPAALAAADGLTAFARAHGLDAGRGIAIDAVAADGRVLDAGARLWPQTERLKIAIARLRRLDNAAEVQAAEAAFLGLQSYLDMPVAGTWRDRLLPDGAWVEEPARGSSLYHITCAYADLMEATAF